jgi:RNA polymerase-binding transcription factor DksA
MDNNIMETIKSDLLAKKDDLVERLAKIEKNRTMASGPLDANSTEQAVELQSKEVIDALDNIENQELKKVEIALQKIDNGQYGTCVSCSEKISASRLKALPHVSSCINCINELEQ